MPESSTQKLLRAALRAGEARDYRKAAELLTALIAEDGAPAEAFLYLGRSYHALGECEKSIVAFRSFLHAGGDAGAGNFYLGRAYLAADRPEEASLRLKRSLELNPDRAAAWAFLGAAQLRLRRSKLAVSCLERAVNLAPEDTRIFRGYLNALFVRACRLVDRGDADMARQILGFVLENGIDGAGPRLWRAKALRELGRFAEALRDCEAAILFSPDDGGLRWLKASLLLASGRQSEALSEFAELKETYPELPGLPADETSLARLRVSIAFRDERWKEAALEALALIRTEPEDAPMRAMAAESLRALGQLEKARDHWLRAIEIDPVAADFRLGLALVLYELGDFEGARAQAERARRLGADSVEVEYCSVLAASRMEKGGENLIPRLQALIRDRGADPRLMFALGECLYRGGRPDLASGWFEKVLLLVPDHEYSLLYRISVAESLEDEAALSPAYAAYLNAYPDNAGLRREYSEILLRASRWEEAVPVLEKGFAYGDDGDRAKRRFALALRNAGKYREAAVHYRDLLRGSPENPEFLLALAWCLERNGKGEYALALLEKAPAAAMKGAGPWIVLGLLHERRGRKEAAVDALRKATELEPQMARAWKDLGLLYRRMGLLEFSANCLDRARALGATVEAEPPKSRSRTATMGGIPSPTRPAGAASGGKPKSAPAGRKAAKPKG